jgi:hypothetical protein
MDGTHIWIAFVVIIVLYISLILVYPVDNVPSIVEAMSDLGVVVATCDASLERASGCVDRLSDLGIKSAAIVNGDTNLYNMDEHHADSIKFKAVCQWLVDHDLPYLLYLDEDVMVCDDASTERRLRKMCQLMSWVKANDESFDILYMGSITTKPTLPWVIGGNVVLASPIGPLCGHSMVLSRRVAERYLQDVSGWKQSIDSWIQCNYQTLVIYQSNQPVFTKTGCSTTIVHPDVYQFIWPILLLFFVVVVPVKLFQSK